MGIIGDTLPPEKALSRIRLCEVSSSLS